MPNRENSVSRVGNILKICGQTRNATKMFRISRETFSLPGNQILFLQQCFPSRCVARIKCLRGCEHIGEATNDLAGQGGNAPSGKFLIFNVLKRDFSPYDTIFKLIFPAKTFFVIK